MKKRLTDITVSQGSPNQRRRGAMGRERACAALGVSGEP
jgi:hypothetical protein